MTNIVEDDEEDNAPDTSDDVSPVRVSFFAEAPDGLGFVRDVLNARDTTDGVPYWRDDPNFIADREVNEDDTSIPSPVDEAVCAAVWNIFAKDSTGRGFDARSARSIRASKALAARHAASGVASRSLDDDEEEDHGDGEDEDEEMDEVEVPAPQIAEPVRRKYVRGEDGLTDRERSILRAHDDLAIEKGPGRASHREIAERAGVEGANEGSRIGSVTNVLRSLRARGLCGPVARRGPKDTFEAPPGLEREVAEMARTSGDGLTTRARVILAAWKALYAERNGPHFSNADVAERAAIVGKSPHSRANNVHGVVRELRVRGLLVPPTKNEETEVEDDMGRERGNDGLTDKQRAVLVAWTALKREKGDDFNNEDVAKRAGIRGGTASSRSANVSGVMRRLRASGMVGDERSSPPKRAIRVPAPGAKAAAPTGRVVPSTEAGDPLLAELLTRRAAAVERVAKLDAAIAAVKAAS